MGRETKEAQHSRQGPADVHKNSEAVAGDLGGQVYGNKGQDVKSVYYDHHHLSSIYYVSGTVFFTYVNKFNKRMFLYHVLKYL